MKSKEKGAGLHPRNLHQGRYDLLALSETVPELKEIIFTNAYGQLSIDFANPDAALWPSQSVVIALQSKVLDKVLTIPAKALQQGPEGAFVWFDEQGKAATAAVEVVLQEKNQVVVTGLTAGQQVIVDGQSRLRKGAELKILTDAPQTAAAEQ